MQNDKPNHWKHSDPQISELEKLYHESKKLEKAKSAARKLYGAANNYAFSKEGAHKEKEIEDNASCVFRYLINIGFKLEEKIKELEEEEFNN